MQNDSQPASDRHRTRIVVMVLALICVLAVGSSIFFYTKYKRTQPAGQAQSQQIVTQLSKVIELPATTPSVVTVTDKSKLTNNTLASRVRNQDILVIYDSAKRIIIYRPSTKKVVDMLSFESQAATPKVQQP